MADEITYSGLSGDYTYTFRLMRDSLIRALYETAAPVLPFLDRKQLQGFASDSEKFPKAPSLSASALTDGTDLTNTAYSPSSVTLTVGEVGLMLTLTDLARLSSITDFEQLGSEAGEAVAEKLITDITALGSGFSTVVGSTGSDVTETEYRSGITTLVINKIKGPYFAVLYPQQIDDLVTSIGSQISAATSTGTSPRAVLNDLTMAPGLDLGALYNVRTLSSTTVPTANAGADSAGMIAGAQRALAYVEKWAIRPEMERDASLRGSEVVVTSAYAVGEKDDNAGVAVISDR